VSDKRHGLSNSGQPVLGLIGLNAFQPAVPGRSFHPAGRWLAPPASSLQPGDQATCSPSLLLTTIILHFSIQN